LLINWNLCRLFNAYARSILLLLLSLFLRFLFSVLNLSQLSCSLHLSHKVIWIKSTTWLLNNFFFFYDLLNYFLLLFRLWFFNIPRVIEVLLLGSSSGSCFASSLCLSIPCALRSCLKRQTIIILFGSIGLRLLHGLHNLISRLLLLLCLFQINLGHLFLSLLLLLLLWLFLFGLLLLHFFLLNLLWFFFLFRLLLLRLLLLGLLLPNFFFFVALLVLLPWLASFLKCLRSRVDYFHFRWI